MVADERARHALLLRLQEVLGEKDAATLMEHLPPDRWNELVTKDDLTPVQADLAAVRSDVHVLRTDVDVLKTDVGVLKSDVGVLKGDVGVLKGDVGVLKGDVGVLKGDVGVLKGDVAELKTGLTVVEERFSHLEENLELRFASAHDRMEAFVRSRLDSQTRMLMFTMLGSVFTVALVALGVG
jgi:hypothetical protein